MKYRPPDNYLLYPNTNITLLIQEQYWLKVKEKANYFESSKATTHLDINIIDRRAILTKMERKKEKIL